MLSIIHVKENKYFYQRCSFCETCFIDEALLPMNYVYKSIPDVSRLFLIKKIINLILLYTPKRKLC